MKKFRLDPETLAVQSFATMALSRARGTVQGAQELAAAPTRDHRHCLQSDQNCESGYCVPTGICETEPCSVHPWTRDQNTCQTCDTCDTYENCDTMLC